ncbi:hypothetical protein AFV9_gp60 [Betalipothrixvirus uzonense]|uniref:Uncharacterized protein n=1 Tax=Betalipothrixvirus uzonense TaxID=512792 RepID=B2CRN7_9VIRU|nr:hypothetical protein AFV9_gp60 [Acidianus filamentous virus 9]ACB37294.1 hypothetical protein [Acidianus filamentous virus 9]
MSYYPLKDKIDKIIDKHNFEFTQAEKYIIDAIFLWFNGISIDKSLVYVFEQLMNSDPNKIPDEDKLAIARLVLCVHPDYLIKYGKSEDIAKVIKSIPGLPDILKQILEIMK